MSTGDPRRCPVEYEREGGRQSDDRIVRCHLNVGHPGEHEEEGTEVTWVNDASAPATPTPVEPHGIVVCSDNPEPHSLTGDCVDPQPAKWTPRAALALMRRERPDLVPDVTDEDRRKADKIIAKASKRCPRCGETRVMHPVYAVCAPCAAECDGSYRGAPKPTVRESHPAYVEATRIGSCRDLIDGAYARGISEGRRQAAEGIAELLDSYRGTDLDAQSAARLARECLQADSWEPTEQPVEVTFPIYVDANGEHWRPADRSEYGSDWLRCVETDRGARFRPSVEREFGPLVAEQQPEGRDR